MKMDVNLLNKFISERDFMSMKLNFTDDVLLKILITQLLPNLNPNESSTPYLETRIRKKFVTADKDHQHLLVEGGEALETKNYNTATLAFTHFLKLVPESSPNIATCYIGRSLALENLEHFNESLDDVERALDLPISIQQRQELLIRHAELVKLDWPLRWQNNLDDPKEEVTLSYGESSEMKGVSNAVSFEYTEQFGRYLVAKRDIKMGDILMIQKPFVSVPERNDQYSKVNEWVCDYCLSLILNPIPCKTCTLCVYCSFDCQSNAFKKYHEMECKIYQYESPVGAQTALFLRTLLVITEQGKKFHEIVTAMEEMKQSADKRNAAFKDGCSTDAVLSLLTHSNKRKPLGIVINAAFVSIALKKHTNFLRGNNLHDVFKLGQLITYLSYISFSNVYNVRRGSYDKLIACGLYPTVSLLNHSCTYNAFTFEDRKRNKVLAACMNIKRGKQIFISYIGHYEAHMTTQERNGFLNKNFFFNCGCKWCVNNYSFEPQLKGRHRLSSDVQIKLKSKPYDIPNLWKILKHVYNMHRSPCTEKTEVLTALTNAYLGSKNEDVWDLFMRLGLVD